MGSSSSHHSSSNHHRRPSRLRALGGIGATVLAALVTLGAAPAGAETATTGYDISFPQCRAHGPHYPENPAFGIVGVNDGVSATNPCLGPSHGQAGELAWAAGSAGLWTQPRVSYYVNAGDPGPGAADWPRTTVGQLPHCAGTWTSSCAYDYGYLRATSSLHLARWVASVDRWIHIPVPDPLGAPWWLDVEMGPEWATTGTPGWVAMNIAAVAGFVDGLRESGVQLDHIGFYSTTYQWRHITGLDPSVTTAYFSPRHPDWVPGARSLEQARSACRPSKSFSGGPVVMTQYESGGFDADYRCP